VKRALVLILICLVFLSTMAPAQTRRRRAPKRSTSTAATNAATERQAAELQAGRARIATQIKTLTQFLYLLGGISKAIETAEQATRNQQTLSPEQIQQTKNKVRESVRNLRAGLDTLETSFRSNPALAIYFPYISGVALIGETAETQVAAGRLDESGRTLIKAVGKLTDALVTMH
jgi:hypothetical protein